MGLPNDYDCGVETCFSDLLERTKHRWMELVHGRKAQAVASRSLRKSRDIYIHYESSLLKSDF
jgi:hypothetical protein